MPGLKSSFSDKSEPSSGREATTWLFISKLGFFGIDLGELNEGGRAINIPGGALTIQDLIQLQLD
jgi:hypothetical protein